MITLLSIPNTGTWFLLDFFMQHSQIDRTISFEEGFWGIGRNEITRSSFEYENVNTERSVYRRHILGNKTHGEIDLLCIGHKAVIPMRDPLASLITRKARNPLDPMYEHIDAFEYVATSPHVSRSFIFPIDTPEFVESFDYRFDQGLDLLKYCDLSPDGYVTDWARWNKPQNTIGKYPEKDAYNAGELAGATKGCVGEFLYLKSKESVLRPFLEGLGYENLIWWG
jgi:hypothetical protein